MRGVGVYEDNTFQGINVSMAGGGYLNIAAKDQTFDGDAADNRLSFRTSSLSSSEMTLSLPIMTGKFFVLTATYFAPQLDH